MRRSLAHARAQIGDRAKGRVGKAERGGGAVVEINRGRGVFFVRRASYGRRGRRSRRFGDESEPFRAGRPVTTVVARRRVARVSSPPLDAYAQTTTVYETDTRAPCFFRWPTHVTCQSCRHDSFARVHIIVLNCHPHGTSVLE